jgi:gamma-glutamyl hercynylcysteine S-oxide synthase
MAHAVSSAVTAAKEPYEPTMIDIPEGEAELGLEPGAGFGWDNEFRKHTVGVPGFSISRYKVTNGEYLEFMKAGGTVPFFWAQRSGRWFYRGMFAETPLALDHPVYVTLDQARDYARWRGKSLPSEPQFQRALAMAPDSAANLNFEHWDTISVTAGQQPGQPSQLTGNGWEWTSTPFAPFPGFEPFPFYTNYSAPFFDGQHFVLKGASPRTAACFARPSFRNWFRPSYPYIYSSFRLVDA